MEFIHCSLDDIECARGTVIVIDVLRAFTTAAFAFDRGAKFILPVATVDEAFGMREGNPDLLLMGETNALPVPGFDLPNSPHSVGQAELAGRTIVHRSTAGTQGIVRTQTFDRMFATGLTTARATVQAILSEPTQTVSFVATGVKATGGGEEDSACAEYMEQLLLGDDMEPSTLVERVIHSSAAQMFLDPEEPDFPPQDVALALDIDRFDFAMPVVRRQDRLILSVDRQLAEPPAKS